MQHESPVLGNIRSHQWLSSNREFESAAQMRDSMTETLGRNEHHDLGFDAHERFIPSAEPQREGDDSVSTFHAHPLGVKPSGNALTSDENAATSIGAFGALPDEMILTLLEWLDSESLLRLGASCRGLFAYATTDQLWKDLFIE